MKFRFIFLIGTTTIVFLFLGYNVYNLQINRGAYYTGRAQAQQAVNLPVASPRGTIYFNGKVPAAMDREFSFIYAVPTDIEDPTETSERLRVALALDPSVTVPLITKKGQYAELISKATAEQVAAITEASIPGIYVGSRVGRTYPFGSLASQVLGFVSQNDKKQAPTGQYGIEARYESVLAQDKDIELTIDPNIQRRAEEILKSLVETWHPTGGTVIVEDPKTGRILAMGNYPSFDPNEYSKSEIATFLNPAVQAVYEPGSIQKVLTMAAGIDSGAITPDTTYVDKGYFTANGYTIRNWDLKAHGLLTMTNVIEQSVNTGSVFSQQQTGNKTFYDYLLKFGFKQPTGIDLPGEVTGKLTPLEKDPRAINYGTAAYGQGISNTPIGMLQAISAIANHGIMNQPHITENADVPADRRVMSERTATQVTQMMVSAVDKAKVAAIPQYRVAGKTGTAFIPEKGGYSENVINTYVGFAPATEPRFIILIKIDRPKNAPLAGQTVVPAFHDLAEFLLNYYDIPPDSPH